MSSSRHCKLYTCEHESIWFLRIFGKSLDRAELNPPLLLFVYSPSGSHKTHSLTHYVLIILYKHTSLFEKVAKQTRYYDPYWISAVIKIQFRAWKYQSLYMVTEVKKR